MESNKNGFALRCKAFKGFTLIEILIVVSIVSLLVIISIGVFRKNIDKGNDGKRKADINRIKVALEEYEKDHDCYPSTVEVACTPGEGLRPYLNKIPCEPKTTTSYVYYPESSACPKWYWVFTKLNNNADNDIADTGCQFGCGPDENTALYNFYESSPNAESPYKAPYPIYPPDENGNKVYGCFSGVCKQIPNLGYCQPNFSNDSQCLMNGSSSCLDAMGNSQQECNRP
jgi:prepilin-type N-terminal cleavage/methylation domain-containing protein